MKLHLRWNEKVLSIVVKISRRLQKEVEDYKNLTTQSADRMGNGWTEVNHVGKKKCLKRPAPIRGNNENPENLKLVPQMETEYAFLFLSSFAADVLDNRHRKLPSTISHKQMLM